MKRAVDEDFPRGGGDLPRGDGDGSAPRARPLKKRAVALPRLDDAPEVRLRRWRSAARRGPLLCARMRVAADASGGRMGALAAE